LPLDVGVVIAAAGRGERMGAGEPKQFRPIAGVPMLLRAVRPFTEHPRVAQIVIALPPTFASTPPPWLRELTGARLRIVAGGARRAESVRAALHALGPACTIVLVHDAARPFVERDTIDLVIGHAAQGTCAVPGVPVADTLKRTRPGGLRVEGTIEREGLWRAQTPQGFPRAVLDAAFAAVGHELVGRFTDEAALVEAVGHAVEIVPDAPTNLKITTPEDFILAEALAHR
jgi:2-C-methyl-D-erythritol 4-phosphate cytidylyltransferase